MQRILKIKSDQYENPTNVQRLHFKKKCANGKISGYSYKTDYFINPLYDTFEQIKLVIDSLKD